MSDDTRPIPKPDGSSLGDGDPDAGGRHSTAFMDTASLVVERPRLRSMLTAALLRTAMILGLGGGIAALLSGGYLLFLVGVRHALAAGYNLPFDGAGLVADTHAGARLSLHWSMLVSTLYGFASFLWYKIEAGRVFGPWISGALFFFVPGVLLGVKVFWPATEEMPIAVDHLIRYYSFAWYAIIFVVAAWVWQKDRKRRKAFVAWVFLVLLCYLPYGYVLFIGEQTFIQNYLGELTSDITAFMQRFLGDMQLALWAVIPLRGLDP